MEQETLLVDSTGNEKNTTASKYILRFNSGANISLDFNNEYLKLKKWLPEGIAFRSWYGDTEWEPSPGDSCSLVLNPSAGNSVWLKPFVLTGTSLADAKVKAVSTQLPQVFAIINDEGQLLPADIRKIIIKDKNSGASFEFELPRDDVSPIFQEAILITANHPLVCEPKAANLWVFKHLTK